MSKSSYKFIKTYLPDLFQFLRVFFKSYHSYCHIDFRTQKMQIVNLRVCAFNHNYQIKECLIFILGFLKNLPELWQYRTCLGFLSTYICRYMFLCIMLSCDDCELQQFNGMKRTVVKKLEAVFEQTIDVKKLYWKRNKSWNFNCAILEISHKFYFNISWNFCGKRNTFKFLRQKIFHWKRVKH